MFKFRMKWISNILKSIIVVLLSTALLWGATQTINTIPLNNSSFIATLQAFLRNENANRFQKKHAGYIFEGGIGTTAAGLSHTISAVTGFPGGYYVYKAATSHTYTNSTRTFVFLDYDSARTITIAGATVTRSTYLVFAEMSAGSVEPQAPAYSTPLMQVDTSGGAITAVSDLRPSGEIAVDCYASLSDAVSRIPTKSTILLNTRAVVSSNLTIPSLAVESGGYLLPASGKTVTITRLTRAPESQWIGGLGSVVFSSSDDYILSEYFGAVGDGSTDDTVAWNSAITAAPSGGSVKVLNKYYRIATSIPITINKIITIFGDGQQAGGFYVNSTSNHGIVLSTTTGTCVLRDFTMQVDSNIATGTRSNSSAMIHGSTNGVRHYIQNILFIGHPTSPCGIGIWKEKGAQYHIYGNYIYGFKYGLYWQNTTNVDTGDDEITGNIIVGASAEAYSTGTCGIYQTSSGGTRIISNLFIINDYGYFLNFLDNDAQAGVNHTGILIIDGNSFDTGNSTIGSQIVLTADASATTETFSQVIISNNTLASGTSSVAPIINVLSPLIKHVTIIGNYFFQLGTTNPDSYGLALTGVTGADVIGNTFSCNATIAIGIGQTYATKVKIGPNLYLNATTTPVNDAGYKALYAEWTPLRDDTPPLIAWTSGTVGAPTWDYFKTQMCGHKMRAIGYFTVTISSAPTDGTGFKLADSTTPPTHVTTDFLTSIPGINPFAGLYQIGGGAHGARYLQVIATNGTYGPGIQGVGYDWPTGSHSINFDVTFDTDIAASKWGAVW